MLNCSDYGQHSVLAALPTSVNACTGGQLLNKIVSEESARIDMCLRIEGDDEEAA